MASATASKSFLQRALQSAVIWSAVFNLLRLGSAILLLPLLLRFLSKEELGAYYMFVAIGQFTLVIDFGFSSTIGRFVSYAMSGATRLVAQGVSTTDDAAKPNLKLLWELLFTTRILYRRLALGCIALLAVIGTPFIASIADQTQRVSHTWLAWCLTIVAASAEIYSTWWNIFLASMNRVTASNRILVASYSLKLGLSCVLLLYGGGLMSVPIAAIIASVLLRGVSRRACLNILGASEPKDARHAWREHFAVIWPNTWRLGLQSSSRFLATGLFVLICGAALQADRAGQLGISLQIFAMLQSMAMVWTSVKWPVIGQLRAQQDIPELQRIFWPRVWLQSLSYLAGAALVVILGPLALEWLGTDKQLIPRAWLIVIALNGFFETQFNIWGTLISTENRLPYLWPSVAANIGSLVLALVLLYGTSLKEGAFVLAPLLVGLLFNYWHWPMEGAKSIRTSLTQFLFTRPRRA